VAKLSKKEQVSSLNEVFSSSTTVIVAHYTGTGREGLNVADVTDLRRKMRAIGANVKVVKNSLAKLSLVDTQFEPLNSLFKGPTAIAYSKDPVAAAKGLVEFAKGNEKLVILGGMVESQVMNVSQVESLATLPSLDALRAKLIGIINTPATQLAGLVQAPAGQLARVIGAYASKGN
jgi:large subunit ribosomal protein L10